MRRRRDREEDFAPDITPLIDIVFLLLIFFMVTSVFKKEEVELLLNLPQTKGKTEAPKKESQKIKIEIPNNDEILFNGKKVTFVELSKEAAKISDKMTPIEVRIDKKVLYENIAKMMGILQSLDITDISFITERE